MVSIHSRNESRKRILLGLIGVSPAIGLITRLIDRRLIFNHSIPNDAITIDKLELADMDVGPSRWHSGHDVIIVDDSVNFYIYMFPKIVIADSGRTEGVNALNLAISVSKKRCKGGSQAAPGSPDFTALAMQLSDYDLSSKPVI